MVYFDNPSNPHLKLHNLESISKICKEKNVLTVVDTSMALSSLQQVSSLQNRNHWNMELTWCWIHWRILDQDTTIPSQLLFWPMIKRSSRSWLTSNCAWATVQALLTAIWLNEVSRQSKCELISRSQMHLLLRTTCPITLRSHSSNSQGCMTMSRIKNYLKSSVKIAAVWWASSSKLEALRNS